MVNNNLNILGLTQGSNVDIFIQLMNSIKSKSEYSNLNYSAYVSFARYFETSHVVKKNLHQVDYLKEWEIFQKAKKNTFDQNQILELNSVLESNLIWKSIIGDRRLIYGKNCKSIEDYKTRFDDSLLYSLAYQFIEEFTNFIKKIKPDIAFGFNPVTFGELLGIEILKKYKIPVLQLHSSRVENYFALHNKLIGTSSHFQKYINNPKKISKKSIELSKKFLNKYINDGIIYEGVNLKKNEYNTKIPFFSILRKIPSSLYHEYKKNLNQVYRNDHHDNGIFWPIFYENIVQNLRKKKCIKFLNNKKRILNLKQLSDLKSFAFYPLHSEPEVALQVLAPPYHKNQIELIRNIAMSLPFGMTLVVKEHPRSFGVRSLEFYKKLLEIPNVYFCNIDLKSIQISKLSKIVFVISSTIGLEAAIIGKPLIILGYPKYLSIPKSMFIQSLNLFNLYKDVNKILNNYKYDKEGIKLFVAGLIEGSIDIDLYSVLLQKQNRYSKGRKNKSDKLKRIEDYEKLTNYTVNRIKEELLNNKNK